MGWAADATESLQKVTSIRTHERDDSIYYCPKSAACVSWDLFENGHQTVRLSQICHSTIVIVVVSDFDSLEILFMLFLKFAVLPLLIS